MRTLVIETATAACSVALIEDGRAIARAHEVVGRGHAERLVPMIAALPDQGRAGRILVDVGPGSFTGVRVGLAAATGLAIGWGGEVSGFSSLALVAAAGRARLGAAVPVAAVLEGGHGEVFVQLFDADGAETAPVASLKPEAALERIAGLPAFGNAAARLGPIAQGHVLHDALPDAADAILLPPAAAQLPPRPIYGRAPDAVPKA